MISNSSSHNSQAGKDFMILVKQKLTVILVPKVVVPSRSAFIAHKLSGDV